MSKKFILLVFFLIAVFTCSAAVIIGKITQQPEPDKIGVSAIKVQQITFSTEIIELTNDQGQNYFVNYRIKREQFRQETKEMLRLLLESDIRQTREQAQGRWLELSHKIAREGEIENVLKMKGFRDVVSEVNQEMIHITILTNELKLQEIFLVKSVTSNITGISEDRVEVTARV